MEEIFLALGAILIVAFLFLLGDAQFMNWISQRLGLQGESDIVGATAMKGKVATVEVEFYEQEGKVTGTVLVDGELWKAHGDRALLDRKKGNRVKVKEVKGLVLTVVCD